MDELFEDLENAVKFDRDQILTNDTIESLQNYSNAGLQGINYTEYITQTRSIISTLNVSQVISELQAVRLAFVAAGDVSTISCWCFYYC